MALIMCAAKSSGRTALKAPAYLPIGVRIASTTYTVFMFYIWFKMQRLVLVASRFHVANVSSF
jgi:hypothetical protein